MAEKKEHKIVSASTGADITGKPRPAASAAAGVKSGNATGLRIGAVLFWIAALAFEVLAIALILEKLLILPLLRLLHLFLLLFCFFLTRTLTRRQRLLVLLLRLFSLQFLVLQAMTGILFPRKLLRLQPAVRAFTGQSTARNSTLTRTARLLTVQRLL